MNSTVIIVSCLMHGLKSSGSTSRGKRGEERDAQEDLSEIGIRLREASEELLGKQPHGAFLSCFHSQVFYVVIESQRCVH